MQDRHLVVVGVFDGDDGLHAGDETVDVEQQHHLGPIS
jgi:hypothetical protein